MPKGDSRYELSEYLLNKYEELNGFKTKKGRLIKSKKLLEIIIDQDDKIKYEELFLNQSKPNLQSKKVNKNVKKVTEKEKIDEKVEDKNEETEEEKIDEKVEDKNEETEEENKEKNEEENEEILDTKIKEDYQNLLNEYNKLKKIIESLEGKMKEHEYYKQIYQCCICHGN